ncbi:TetR/AcrR family transcriptional regulator [Streptomyces sp. NBC_00564]|uniref:TetR/AcrR family transcriptional regulator n=1 Tax=Streptomyces sp. NBC_00564 TaxID=2903663 RepID=UPI002FCD87DB|nr:TetR/AcrR family transcriptional regulator [Streptomyces sp. NBC_00564]
MNDTAGEGEVGNGEAANGEAGNDKAGNGEARKRRARGSLSRAEILRAADSLLSEGGPRALTMPALARELGAGVASIYWYFRNKEELLIALADEATEEMYRRLPPPGAGPWQEELARYFTALRHAYRTLAERLELLRARPGAQGTAATPEHGSAADGRAEACLLLLTGAGLPPADARRVYRACWTYTRGYALIELGRTRQSGDGGRRDGDELRAAVARLDPAGHPLLTGLPDVARLMSTDDEHFARGLRLLLDGAAKRLPVRRRHRSAP